MKVLIILLMLLSYATLPGSVQKTTTDRGTLRGRVENQQGEPVAEVKVRAISRRTDKLVAEVTTDEEGRFSLADLPEGRYALVFYSPRYQQATIPSIEVKAGQEKRLERPVRLKPAELYAIIDGAVFDHRGYLVPGARVVIERVPIQDEPVSSVKQEGTTNTSGEFAFRLPGMAARYRLTASAKGFRPSSITVDIGGPERRHVSLQLEPES